MDIVIFSKNRAMQLDALLNSMEHFYPNHEVPTVIYSATTKEFDEGYKLLQFRHDIMIWNDLEMDFKSILEMIVRNNDYEHIMFLVDDNIFIRPFGTSCLRAFDNKALLTVSNRLGRNIDYCYSHDKPVIAPKTTVYEWRNEQYDFGYPMSLDGNVFRVDDIKNAITGLNYSNPNQLEASLAGIAKEKFGSLRPLMYMEMEPCIVGVPANRVQEEYKNRHGNTADPAELNDMFLNGKIIDIEPFMYMETNACHVEKEYTYKWYN